jgi:predicted ATPase
VQRLKTGVLFEPILVGREKQLEELKQCLDLAIEGKGNTVFVSGEAGAGKTRLATEFLNRAKELGVTVLTGWCLSNSAVPYFPFFEAFNTYFSEERGQENKIASTQQLESRKEPNKPKRIWPEEPEITAWLMGPSQAEKLVKPQAISPQVWKDQTFAAVAKTLIAISSTKTIILFIDDVHWADSASLALIHYIARTINSEKVLLLATFRSEQLTSDAEGRPHPLVETLRLMRREDLFKEIKIANLNKTIVSDLAKGMLGSGLQEQFAEKLAEESKGNPLFVVESLRMLHERGGLMREGDQWRLSVNEIGLPPKIKDIILQRLSLLLRNQRRILDAASVIGEKFNVEILAPVLSSNRLEIIETLDVIAKDTSLICCEGESYWFDHARSRDAIYEEVSSALKREYHARVAETLESTSKNGKLAFSEVAYHYAQAGNTEKAVEYALAAGQDALARWSNTEAAQHFAYVLKTVGEKSEHAEERLSAQEGLGDAFFANCMFKEATKIFEDLANTSETDVVRLRALRKAIKSALLFGDRNHRMELIKKAEVYASADRLESARVLFDRAGTGQNLQAMIKDTQTALQVFEEEYSLLDTAKTLTFLGALRARLEMPQEGLAESLRSISLFEELGDFRSLMEGYWFTGLTFNNCLLFQEAFEMFAKIIEIDEKMKTGEYMTLINANVFSSMSLATRGNFENALTYILKALELSKKTDSMSAQGMVYSNLTVQYTRLGDLKHAEEYFDELLKLRPEILKGTFVRGTLVKAVFFAGKNQWEKSNQYFNEHLKWLKDCPTPAGLANTRAWYAWALEQQGRLEEAKVQLEANKKIRREAEARFEHADLQAHLMVRRQAVAGEEFEMRIDLVNIGRKPALMVKVEDIIPNDFKVVALPSFCSLRNGDLEMKEKLVGSFEVETVKLKLKATKAGTYSLHPEATYVSDLGKTKTFKANPITINAQPVKPAYEALPGRITTGYGELDRLLLGGIPQNYAVALTAPSTDEKELLVKRFLEAGATAGEITFYITAEAVNIKAIAEKYASNFYLLICNPQVDAMIQSLPNVFKLKGVENLTDIDIALAKAFRMLKLAQSGSKRICIEVVSDVLLQHHAVNTRRWLSALLPTLKLKGFTILAVVDPSVHPSEELQAVLGVFDGEIRVTEKETPEGIRQALRVRKLVNQKYLDKEIILSKQALSN